MARTPMAHVAQSVCVPAAFSTSLFSPLQSVLLGELRSFEISVLCRRSSCLATAAPSMRRPPACVMRIRVSNIPGDFGVLRMVAHVGGVHLGLARAP
jgi:hypothetical protein